MKHKVAFIGLGVMGQRMLGNMNDHSGYDLYMGWDPDDRACTLTKQSYPGIRIGKAAEEIITNGDVDVVYICCPPIWHSDYVAMAVAAGKPVFCEKPLGVDLADSRAMVQQVEDSGTVNAVNFPFADAAAVHFIQSGISPGTAGDVVGVDVRLHFSSWPRDWQVGAADWLAKREQGGFTREVLTHYVFLIERLFGPTTFCDSIVTYPDGPGGEISESHMHAQLDSGGIPVSVAASVGGAGPDLIEFTVWGQRRSHRLYNWNRVRVSDGSDWQEVDLKVDDLVEDGRRRVLDNFKALLEGQSSTMPNFRSALSVQELVEKILAT